MATQNSSFEIHYLIYKIFHKNISENISQNVPQQHIQNIKHNEIQTLNWKRETNVDPNKTHKKTFYIETWNIKNQEKEIIKMWHTSVQRWP